MSRCVTCTLKKAQPANLANLAYLANLSNLENLANLGKLSKSCKSDYCQMRFYFSFSMWPQKAPNLGLSVLFLISQLIALIDVVSSSQAASGASCITPLILNVPYSGHHAVLPPDTI